MTAACANVSPCARMRMSISAERRRARRLTRKPGLCSKSSGPNACDNIDGGSRRTLAASRRPFARVKLPPVAFDWHADPVGPGGPGALLGKRLEQRGGSELDLAGREVA